MDSKDIVREGYDKVSLVYRTERGEGTVHDYVVWIAELIPLLSPMSHILDLGCGCGLPVAKLLAEKFVVTGVDISPVQIRRAKELVPQARFIYGDMTKLNFGAGRFDAIVSFFSIFHVPLAEQPELFKRITHWLRPEGYLMAMLGHEEWTGVAENWLGVRGATMYWSHADSETYQKWLVDLGLKICWTRFIPERNGCYALLLARKE